MRRDWRRYSALEWTVTVQAGADRGRRPEAAGQGAEATEGVARGGAHLKMGNDEGPGPLTHASVS